MGPGIHYRVADIIAREVGIIRFSVEVGLEDPCSRQGELLAEEQGKGGD